MATNKECLGNCATPQSTKMNPASLTESLLQTLQALPGLQFSFQDSQRLQVRCKPDILPAFLELLKGRCGYHHLSAICCIDQVQTKRFELVYQLWSYQTKVLLSAQIEIGKKPGRYLSIHSLFPPALFFERDLQTLFGIVFEGTVERQDEPHSADPPLLKSSSVALVSQAEPEWIDAIQAQGGHLVAHPRNC